MCSQILKYFISHQQTGKKINQVILTTEKYTREEGPFTASENKSSRLQWKELDILKLNTSSCMSEQFYHHLIIQCLIGHRIHSSAGYSSELDGKSPLMKTPYTGIGLKVSTLLTSPHGAEKAEAGEQRTAVQSSCGSCMRHYQGQARRLHWCNSCKSI